MKGGSDMRYKDIKEIREKAIEVANNSSLAEIRDFFYNGPINRKGSTVFVNCPNPMCSSRHSKKPENCAITDSKNAFHCFACGKGGGPVGFYSLLMNKSISDSSMDIALMKGAISQSTYDEVMNSYGNHKKLCKDEALTKRLQQKKEETKVYQVAKSHILNIVYSAMLELEALKLTDKVKKHLSDKRKLPDEWMKNKEFFCYHKSFTIKELMDKIHEKYPEFKLQNLAFVPGFYFKYQDGESKKGWWRFIEPPKSESLGLVIRNAEGEIVGLQQRNLAVEKSGYYWVSSNKINEKAGYDMGVSPGSPIHVEYPSVITNPIIIITEGRFKAIALAESTGSITLSLQGVNSCSQLLKVIDSIKKSSLAKSRLHPKFKGGKKFSLGFYFSFDADMWTKPQVYTALYNGVSQLREAYPNALIQGVVWNESYGKGFDDLKNNYPDEYMNMVHRIPMENMLSLYQTTLTNLLKNSKWIGRSVQEISQSPQRDDFFREFSTLCWEEIPKYYIKRA